MNDTVKKVLGILAVAFVIILTLGVVKVLPALLKVVAVAANFVTIYWAYTLFKNKKTDKK